MRGKMMKKIREMVWIVWLAAWCFVITPSIVWADVEDILLRFQPYVSVEEYYNSNIYLTSKNPTDDFVTTISAGFRFSTLPRSEVTGEFRETPTAEERYAINIDLRGGYSIYAKEEANNFYGLDGTLDAWYGVTQNLTFRVREYFTRSNELREADYTAAALPGQLLLSRTRGELTGRRAIYYRNVFSPSMEYRFGRENLIAITYQSNVYEIDSRIYEDSMAHTINPSLTYWFDIRNGISFEYQLDLGYFERFSDLIGHRGMGRYTYRFNPRTSIFGEYTQLWREFNPPIVFDYTVYRPSIGIEHAFSSTLTSRVQLGYFWKVPVEGSSTDGFFYDVSLAQSSGRTTYEVSSQGGYTEDYFTAENLGFSQYYRTIARITHVLSQKVTLELSGSYEWSKPGRFLIDGKIPRDNIWAVRGTGSYQVFRWLSVFLLASHRENRSTLPVRDYSEYSGIFGIRAAY